MNKEELEGLLRDHQIFHSDLQIDRFITSREGMTEYGCYKQAMRELYKRWRGLKGLLQSAALLDVDLEEKEHELAAGTSTFQEKRLRIEIQGLRLGQEESQRALQDTAREFGRFAGHVAYFKEKIGPLTPEKRAELDAEMWAHKIKSQAALDLMANGRLSRETCEMLRLVPGAGGPAALRAWLPYDPKAKDAADAEKRKDGLIQWYVSQKPVLVDESHALPCSEVLALLEAPDG